VTRRFESCRSRRITEKMMIKKLTTALAMLLMSIVPMFAIANNFYENRTLKLIIRVEPGGTTDSYGRLVAKHIGKHIPGNPQVMPQNMPGAGGVLAANYLHNQSPNDGTVIVLFSGTAVMQQRRGEEGVAYDVTQWNLLGSAAGANQLFVAHRDSGITSLSDIMTRTQQGEVTRFSMTGPGSGSYLYSSLLGFMGANIELITGYDGTSGKVLGVMQKETQATSSSYASLSKHLKINPELVAIGKLGNVPDASLQDIQDIITTPEQQDVYDIVTLPVVAGQPFAAPPGVPEDRVELLRAAFASTLVDPEFLAEAKKLKMDITFVDHAKLLKLYAKILNTPDDVIAKVQ
jgi:tripartite-type tricarboxylate transporter receptor subunit TctC